jgi:hypothetical protein
MGRGTLQKFHAEAQAPRFPMQVKNAHDSGMRDMPQGEKFPGKGLARRTQLGCFGQKPLQRHQRPGIAAFNAQEIDR